MKFVRNCIISLRFDKLPGGGFVYIFTFYNSVGIEILNNLLSVLIHQLHNFVTQLLLFLFKFCVNGSFEDSKKEIFQFGPTATQRVIRLNEEKSIKRHKQRDQKTDFHAFILRYFCKLSQTFVQNNCVDSSGDGKIDH